MIVKIKMDRAYFKAKVTMQWVIKNLVGIVEKLATWSTTSQNLAEGQMQKLNYQPKSFGATSSFIFISPICPKDRRSTLNGEKE